MFDKLLDRFGEPEILVGPDAPKWRFAALKIERGLMVSGKGADATFARASCLGEAAEVMSAFRRADDSKCAALSLPGEQSCEVDPAHVTINAIDKPNDPGTEGLGTGRTAADAKQAALLERVERHYVAEWWTGGALAGRIPPAWLREHDVLRVEGDARAGATNVRHTEFLCLNDRGPVHVVAAVSRLQDGNWPVLGFAAHFDAAEACRKALSELFQMELSLTLARISQMRGERSANAPALRRSLLLTGAKRHLLEGEAYVPPAPKPLNMVEAAVHLGVEIYLADLTREDIGVPVWRALAPGLSSARALKFTEEGGPL